VKTSKMAFDAKLSRETVTVAMDKDTEELVIVEKVLQKIGNDDVRFEVYYKAYSKEKAKDRNKCLVDAKDSATLNFLGKGDCDCGCTTVAAAKPATAAAKPAAVSKKKAPVSKKKAAVSKPAATKTVEPDSDLDNFGDDGLEGLPEMVEEEPVLYNKGLSDHGAQLSPIITEMYGEGWKKDNVKVTKVRSLIAALNEKVPVLDAAGLVLESFNTFCRERLAI